MGAGEGRDPAGFRACLLFMGSVLLSLCSVSFVADAVVTRTGAEVLKKGGMVQIEIYCLN